MTEKSFTGGDTLMRKLAELAKGLESGGELRVGFLEGSTSTPGGLNTPTIAAIHEFGAPRAGIPPRSFFRPMIADKSPSWAPKLGAALKATAFDAEAALELMGEDISGELSDAIISVVSPPLSPVTLMLRKMRSEDQSLIVSGKTVGEAAARVAAGESPGGVSTKPLVDTGDMLRAVSYEVKPK